MWILLSRSFPPLFFILFHSLVLHVSKTRNPLRRDTKTRGSRKIDCRVSRSMKRRCSASFFPLIIIHVQCFMTKDSLITYRCMRECEMSSVCTSYTSPLFSNTVFSLRNIYMRVYIHVSSFLSYLSVSVLSPLSFAISLFLPSPSFSISLAVCTALYVFVRSILRAGCVDHPCIRIRVAGARAPVFVFVCALD